PPKKPASAYFIFLSRTSTDVPKSRLEANEATKSAATIWNKMTDAEKKPYFDEYKILYADFETRRAKWHKDPKNAPVLRKLNKDRKKHGKHRIHVPEGIAPKRPMTGFLRLVSSSLQLFADSCSCTKNWVIWAAQEAGSRWKALPEAEKTKFKQQFYQAR
ncbi:hypothetical protein BU17DRAFT_39290, partial [Hysterangium stoloniferum]